MFVFKHPFYDMDGEIGGSPSVEGAEETASAEIASVQETPSEETPTESESSFAKRLREHSEKAIRAEREKWEAEVKSKYGDYDVHREISAWLQEQNGLDALTLKEQIELQRLQERADQQQVPVEVLRRIQELEQKASKADEMEQQQQEGQRVQSYFSSLNDYVKDKGVEAEKLNQFMIENGMMYDPANMEKSFAVAYKAMMHDELASKLESAEKEGVKKFLQAKGSIPTVPGSSAQGHVASTQPKTWAEARQRAMQRGDG